MMKYKFNSLTEHKANVVHYFWKKKKFELNLNGIEDFFKKGFTVHTLSAICPQGVVNTRWSFFWTDTYHSTCLKRIPFPFLNVHAFDALFSVKLSWIRNKV